MFVLVHLEHEVVGVDGGVEGVQAGREQQRVDAHRHGGGDAGRERSDRSFAEGDGAVAHSHPSGGRGRRAVVLHQHGEVEELAGGGAAGDGDAAGGGDREVGQQPLLDREVEAVVGAVALGDLFAGVDDGHRRHRLGERGLPVDRDVSPLARGEGGERARAAHRRPATRGGEGDLDAGADGSGAAVADAQRHRDALRAHRAEARQPDGEVRQQPLLRPRQLEVGAEGVVELPARHLVRRHRAVELHVGDVVRVLVPDRPRAAPAGMPEGVQAARRAVTAAVAVGAHQDVGLTPSLSRSATTGSSVPVSEVFLRSWRTSPVRPSRMKSAFSSL